MVRLLFSLVTLAFAAGASPAGRGAARDWKRPKSWGYQLQAHKKEELAASKFDILVIDEARDGQEAQRWTREDLEAIRGGRPRLILAYLSIGEAERYRSYWEPGWDRSPPEWLDEENPDWAGNYKVRYWVPAWQKILFGSPESRLDRIIAAGFDGVYLDIIDAYEFYEEKGRERAREEMKDLVLAMARYARGTPGNYDFGVFPQNGEELLEDKRYLDAVTGIGREDTYYGYSEDGRRTPAAVTRRFEAGLDRAVKAGKLVLNVDYVTASKGVLDAHRQAKARGYLEYCGERSLSKLTPQPGEPQRAP